MNQIPSVPLLILLLALAATLLVGCGERQASTTETIAPEEGEGSAPAGPGALDFTNELALGTLKLEETEHAVTPAQAVELLPLWQVVQGGSPPPRFRACRKRNG